ncbi:MAG: hypothetical protein BAJATHORv1_60098 [Candidatus Thorarchaeota archaeon]|nr:MAG: hypothetical protein BAJATHORv1_60098 [Candidatus Thorarchaeota archaeon]
MEQIRQIGNSTLSKEYYPNPENKRTVNILLEVSMPIIMFSILSLGISIIMLLYAVLMMRGVFGAKSRSDEALNREKILIPDSIAREITSDNILKFLGSLLTEDEVRIIISLAKAIITDRGNSIEENRAGLRNKYQISSESGVAQRSVYDKGGPIDRLVEVGIITKIEAEKKTGGQKYLYSLSKESYIIAPLIAVLESNEE